MKNINPTNNETENSNKLEDFMIGTFGNDSSFTDVKCFNCGCMIPADSSKSLFENCKEFVARNNPYILLISLPFDETFDANKSVMYAEHLLAEIRDVLFGVNHLNDDTEYLEGFIFVETHKQVAGNTYTYINILVKHDLWYNFFSFDKIIDIFYAAESKVFAGTKLVSKGRIQSVLNFGEDVAIEFCFQHIEDKKLRNVVFFGSDGLYSGVSIGEQQ